MARAPGPRRDQLIRIVGGTIFLVLLVTVIVPLISRALSGG